MWLVTGWWEIPYSRSSIEPTQAQHYFVIRAKNLRLSNNERPVCRRIDELQDQENGQALSQLRVGPKVTFNGRKGPTVGIVTKINRKSVIVLAEEDGLKQYKVSPSLLRPLRDVYLSCSFSCHMNCVMHAANDLV
jgi:hypothetical protein